MYAWSFSSQGTDRLGSSDEFIDAALRWFDGPDPMAGSPWDKGKRLVRKGRTLLVLDGVEPLQWGPGVQLGKLKDPALGYHRRDGELATLEAEATTMAATIDADAQR